MPRHGSYSAAVLQIGPEAIGVPTVVIAWLVVVLGSLLIAALVVVMAQSLRAARRTQRRERVRQPMRDAIISRMHTSDPHWDNWVAELDAHQRTVVKEELDGLLRMVSGEETETLAALADALDIPQRARQAILDGDRYDRLDALTWLTLLEQPVAPAALREHCTDSPDERAAAVRLLLASDHPQAVPVGLDLLFAASDDTLSVFGLDTLYQLAEHDPAAVIDRVIEAGIDWEPQLLVQTLLVVERLGVGDDPADVRWLVTLLDHDSSAVRAATARVLGRYGWEKTLRAKLDPQALLTDPEPTVRAAAYEMLARWGDADALATLVMAASTETDDRARTRAARALCNHPEAIPDDPPAPLTRALRWTAISRNVRVRAGATEVRTPVPKGDLPSAADDRGPEEVPGEATSDTDSGGFEWGEEADA